MKLPFETVHAFAYVRGNQVKSLGSLLCGGLHIKEQGRNVFRHTGVFWHEANVNAREIILLVTPYTSTITVLGRFWDISLVLGLLSFAVSQKNAAPN